MIELTPLARPYAKAMFAAALEDKSLTDTSKELETIALAANSLGYAPFFAFIMKSLCEKVNNYSKIDFFIKERK